MIYVDQDLEEFKKKWKLCARDYNCPKCGGIFETNIPIYLADTAGLISDEHECGPEYTAVVLVPRTKDAKEFWNSIF